MEFLAYKPCHTIITNICAKINKGVMICYSVESDYSILKYISFSITLQIN